MFNNDFAKKQKKKNNNKFEKIQDHKKAKK